MLRICGTLWGLRVWLEVWGIGIRVYDFGFRFEIETVLGVGLQGADVGFVIFEVIGLTSRVWGLSLNVQTCEFRSAAGITSARVESCQML